MSEFGKLTCYVRRSRALMHALGAGMFVLAGIWMVTIGQIFWGSIAIAFFGACFVVILTKIAARSPALQADEKGLHYKTYFGGLKFLPWASIANVFLLNFQSQKFLSIDLTEDARKANLSGWLDQQNKKLGSGDITVIVHLLDLPSEEIVSRVETMWKTFR